MNVLEELHLYINTNCALHRNSGAFQSPCLLPMQEKNTPESELGVYQRSVLKLIHILIQNLQKMDIISHHGISTDALKCDARIVCNKDKKKIVLPPEHLE